MLGQFAHFAGNHGKALAMDAGARRFNVRVERQNTGLRGDGGDELGHFGDTAASSLQAENGVFAFVTGLAVFFRRLRKVGSVFCGEAAERSPHRPHVGDDSPVLHDVDAVADFQHFL